MRTEMQMVPFEWLGDRLDIDRSGTMISPSAQTHHSENPQITVFMD